MFHLIPTHRLNMSTWHLFFFQKKNEKKKKVEFPVNCERGDNYTHTHTQRQRPCCCCCCCCSCCQREAVHPSLKWLDPDKRRQPNIANYYIPPPELTLLSARFHISLRKKQKTKEEFPKEESEKKINNNRLLPSLLVWMTMWMGERERR